ncbi:MAG: Ig-like domain-containing protein [Treponemataceae bacterium]|nr:Ig-like domain-containing protein [Treponemataceae bacterium]
MKKTVLLTACLLTITGVVFAGGKRDNEMIDLGTQTSWQDSFPLEEKKPGTYNVVVTAEDLGGNISTVGPFNLAVDPESDLPVTGITNPPPEMRVPGNLNIVGTCIDDDAVEYVELTFDGDTDHPVIAEGKEFWSYYLDTTKLSEGPHVITVTGVDTHGTRGHSVSARWHLDRKMPVTEVHNYGLGDLVSGKISLSGQVIDGNGIKELLYSTDGGTTFEPVKLKYDKKADEYTFTVTIDTKKQDDGPQVCWFKATDQQGTVGTSSFLYFVDNTKPEITLMYPQDNQAINGIFSVAGSAYDRIGIEKLTWQLGKDIGEFELTDGNPYWVHEFDIRGETAKAQELIITATDIAGNVTVFKKKLTVDLEADRPVVHVAQPVHDFALNAKENDVFIEDELYIRGQITDDDGVATLHWKVDAGATNDVASQGVFYVDVLASLSEKLSAGLHKVTIWATDVHGIVGREVVIPFVAKGAAPSFGSADTAVLKTRTPAAAETAYVPGIEINAEGVTSLAASVSSECGLTGLRWTFNGKAAGEQVIKSVKGTTNFDIPLAGAPWGLVEVTVTAEDMYGRTTDTRYLVYRTDLTTVRGEPKVFFTDSTIAENGRIDLSDNGTASGYFIGGKAVSVEIVPENEFVTAKLKGNSIILSPQKVAGVSQPFTVKVTTDKDLSYESRQLTVAINESEPTLKLKASAVYDGFKDVSVSGTAALPKVAAADSELKVQYRIFEAPAAVDPLAEKPEPQFKKVDVAEDGSFTIDLPARTFKEGVSVIEVVAQSSYSGKTADAAFVSKVSPLPEPDYEADPKAKPPVAAPAALTWFQGENLYYTAYYQGTLDSVTVNVAGAAFEGSRLYPQAGMIPGSMLVPGTVNVDVKVLNDAAKAFASKTTVKTGAQPSVAIDRFNDTAYVSGLVYELPAVVAKDRSDVIRVVVDSPLPVADATYTITGEQNAAFGSPAAVNESGKLTLKKLPDGDGNQYEAFITLKGYPAERTHITVAATTDKETYVTAKGTASFVRARPDAGIENQEQVYWKIDRAADADSVYNLAKGEGLKAFVNVPAPYKVEIKDADTYNGGVKVTAKGSVATLEATAEGVFEDIVLLVTDSQGITYESSPVTLRGDWSAPNLKVVTPDEQQWLQATLPLVVEASDTNGLTKVEYSFNAGKTWSALEPAEEENRFGGDIDMTDQADGLVCVDVHAVDAAGKETVRRLSVFKDTTPPQVITVTPAKGQVVNGETRVVLLVSDNGRLVSGQYVYPKDALALAKEKLAAAEALSEDPEQEEPVEVYKNNISPLSALDSMVSFVKELKLGSSVSLMVGKNDVPIGEDMQFEFVDASGNKQVYVEKEYRIDAESDKPVIEIHLPAENAIETTDFIVSGIVYDDDGNSRVWYKIDDGEYQALSDWGTSWSINVPLHSLTDNEHTITVYAEDQFGIVGDSVTRTVRISLEEPFGCVNTPTFEETVTNRITLTGNTSDANGIAKVQVSVDNGNTWHTVSGLESWEYEFDTRVIQDGTHVVFLKVWDDYGVQGLYSSLINIDNNGPDITLSLPLDDSTFTTTNIPLSGQTTDNIGLKKLYVQVRHLGESGEPIPEQVAYKDLEVSDIINEVFDVRGLPDGTYNLEISGEDSAGNVTRVSRNFTLDTKASVATINQLYPMNGESIQGVFNIYGTVVSEVPIERVSLLVDGKEVDVQPVNLSGYYKFTLTPEQLAGGEHVYSVRAVLPDGRLVYSVEQFMKYSPSGPWISIDSLAMGDFAVDRPYLEGRAGYSLTEAEVLMLNDKATPKYEKEKIREKAVESVEISFNNGKTFEKVGSRGAWRYRIENGEMPDGYHFLVVRANMKNGETAVTRTIIQIDKTAPTIKLISPGEGGRYNEALAVSGLSNDDVVLKKITVELRQGDKANYEMPAFIQGLYVDANFWGNTLYSVGAGLTFYDDNVKLQAQFGQMTQVHFDNLHQLMGRPSEPLRYGGNVFGLKLLANVGNVPFSYLFGPDWTWLSAAFAIGANFSYFSYTQADKGQILSALIGQIEFPRVTMDKRKMFRTISLYTEGQIWSIPTDVKTVQGAESVPPLVPQLSIGMRMSVF